MNFINMQNYFKCNGHEKYWHKYICTHIQTYLHTFFCAHVCVRELILLKFIMWYRYILLLGFFSHKFYNFGLYNNILKSFGQFWFRICHTFFFHSLFQSFPLPKIEEFLSIYYFIMSIEWFCAYGFILVLSEVPQTLIFISFSC